MQHDHREPHDHDNDVRTKWRRKAMRRAMRDHGHGHFEFGGRMRRGEIRTALLGELAEAPGHGYEIMQRLETKSGGAWRPSPGSVYPTLQMLEDEGLVRSVERDDKRVYEITDTGRAEFERRSSEAGGAPWEGERSRSPRGQLKENAAQVMRASAVLSRIGTEEQVQLAVDIVRDARKRLYGLLAED